jgi:hypothetical protein
MQTTQKKIKKHDKVKFNDIGSFVVVEVDCERFHNNFRVGF